MNRSLSFFILIFWIFHSGALGQNLHKKDSLLSVLGSTQDTDQKTTILIQLSIFYDATDLEKSIDYAKKALKEAEKKKTPTVISEAYNNLANVYEYKSQTDSSLIYHEKALALRLKNDDFTKIGDSYNNIGIAYDKLGNFPRSLDHYFKALRNYEKEKDLEKQAMVLSNIGIVYKAQKEYEKTLDYYQKAHRIYQDLNSDFGIAVSEGNIGGVLLLMKKYDESIDYATKAKRLYEKIGYERYTAYPLINIAVAYDSLKNYPKAEKFYREAIDLNKNHQNDYEIANSLKAYGSMLLKQNKNQSSIHLLQEALGYTKSSNAVLLEVEIRRILAKAYAQSQNFDQAYAQMEVYASGRDSLFEQEKTKAVFELEKQYETEKKEKQILIQRAELAENKLSLERKNTWMILIIGLALLIGLIGYFFYRNQKLKNEQLRKENQLKDALIRIEAQNKVQEERLRISRDLHDNIGSQLTFIISSLDNLKFQLGKENPEAGKRIENINEFTRTTITELRDTIWAMNKENILFSDLKVRISNFLENAKSHVEHTDFEIEMNESIDENHSFSAFEGINLYRVIQEAVNNAIKHAEASHIKVSFEKIENHFEVKVSDNGKGIGELSKESGNGLNNMYKRIADLGGELIVKSEPGKGTVLRVVFS